MDDFTFNLEDKVMEPISGLEGTIVAKVQYLHDANSYLVQSAMKGNNEIQESKWITEGRLLPVTV